MNGRRLLLVVALVATVGASLWVSTQDGEDAGAELLAQPDGKARESSPPRAAAARARASSSGGTAARSLEGLSATRAPWPAYSGDIARVVSFAPAPLAPRAAPRSAPLAPPLPFRFVGAIDDAQGKAVFLLDDGQVRMVRIGEQVAGQYRLERITASGIEFTYLPLDITQTLSRPRP